MTTVLRIFIKPAGQLFVETPLTEGQTMQGIIAAWRHEGLLWTPAFIVPWDSVLYALTYEIPTGAKLSVVPGPWKPPETPA